MSCSAILVRMTKQLVIALLLLVSVAPLAAQLEEADAQTRAKYKEYLKTPLPAEALAIVTPKTWPDLSGTARGMFEIDAQQSFRDDFLAAVESFEKGDLPNGTATGAADADARLNAAYRKALQDAEEHKQDHGSAVKPDGIREAERAWLKYRNAWIAFAMMHYPGVRGDAWLILLSNDRTSVSTARFAGWKRWKAADRRATFGSQVHYPRIGCINVVQLATSHSSGAKARDFGGLQRHG